MSPLSSNSARNEVDTVSAQPARTVGKSKFRRALKWTLTGLPLGGIAFASFLPLQLWMQQALVLITIVWFYVFFLMDSYFLGG